MATLPTNASLTGATTTNAQQKTNLSAILQFLTELLGTDSGNKAAARTALGALSAADITGSFANNGYVRIPTASGTPLIIQWALVNVTAVNGGTMASAFPIRFPNTCFQVLGAQDVNGSSAQILAGIASGDRAGQMLFQSYATGAALAKYIAIGN